MRKLRKALVAEQIKDEIRKLNQIGKIEIRRSFDEEAAVDLILRVGAPRTRTEVQGMPTEVGISSVIKYRLLVGGVGIAYEGESELEAGRPGIGQTLLLIRYVWWQPKAGLAL